MSELRLQCVCILHIASIVVVIEMTMMYATLGLVADSRDFHKSSPEYVRTVLLCFRSLKVGMAYSILQNMAECVLTVRFLPTEP